MLRTGCVRGNKGQVDIGCGSAAQFNLGLFSSFLQALCRDLVLLQVNAVLFLELLSHIVNDPLVEIITAQTGVAVGAQHFENAVTDVQDTDVEGTAAQVVNQDLLVVFLIEAVCQRSGCRLIDNTQNFQSGNAARVLCGLALTVVEIGRYGDNRLADLFTQIAFGSFFHLGQDHRADVLGGVLLPVNIHFIAGTHLTLDGNHSTVRIGNRLALGDLADQPFTVFGESDY